MGILVYILYKNLQYLRVFANSVVKNDYLARLHLAEQDVVVYHEKTTSTEKLFILTFYCCLVVLIS
jgi:hypothetical protein